MMTIIIIVFTAIVSIPAFNNKDIFLKLQFNPYQIYHRKQWFRLLTHGFLHANWLHLIINMMVLYFFGPHVEYYLTYILGHALQPWHHLIFLLFYLAAIVVASLTSLFRHKDDPWYNAVGASGAVSAMLFFYIFFNPWELLYIYGVLPVPGIIMGVLYLIYSHYMSRKEEDNVNHDAHITGAIFGFIFPLFINFSLIFDFFAKLTGFTF